MNSILDDAFFYLFVRSYAQCKCVNPTQHNSYSIVISDINHVVMANLRDVNSVCLEKVLEDFDLT